MNHISSGRFISLVYEGKAFEPIVKRLVFPTIEPAYVVRFRDCFYFRQRGFLMWHQLCSSRVGSEKSLLSLGFSCAGLSRASQKVCQFFELSSKDRASAISCSARTQALSKIKFVMFTPRCSAP